MPTAPSFRRSILLLLAVAGLLLVHASASSASTLGHPAVAFPEDFPDPAIAYDAASHRYCAFATAADDAPIQRRCSWDRITWSPIGSAFCDGAGCVSPQPGGGWAPAVAYLGGAWRLYWADPQATPTRKCIRVASAATLDGRFVPEPASALDCHAAEGGGIDPFVFVDPASGDPYLQWKMEGDVIGGASRLVSQRLAADGLGFAPGSSYVELLRGTAEWERRHNDGHSDLYVENPATTESNGTYYLFYSASDWNSNHYATGLATCAGPLGPCTKKSTAAPWMGPSGTVWGPGGASTFVDPDGEPWLAYHAWAAPCFEYEDDGSCQRQVRIQNLLLSNGTAQARVNPGTMAVVAHTLPSEPAGSGQLGWYNLDARLSFDPSSNLAADARWGMRFQLGGAGEAGQGFVGLDPLAEVGDYGVVGATSLQRAMLFSIRGATDYKADYAGNFYNVKCDVTTGEGGGVSCAAQLDWVAGHTYRLRVWEVCCASQPSDDEWWGAWVIDEDSGIERFIAQIQVPGGWDWIRSQALFEVAYDGTVNDCNGIVRSEVTIETIEANAGTAAPESRAALAGGACPGATQITPAGDGYTIVAGTAAGGSCGIGIELVFLPALAWAVREGARRRRSRAAG